jgi:hypothetical protein
MDSRPSGLTVATYCRDHGIKNSAFNAWKGSSGERFFFSAR